MLIFDALLVATASVSMTVLNKRAIDVVGDPLLIVSLQMATGAVLTGLCTRMHFGKEWKRWLVVPPIICLMLLTSMVGMQHATLGSFVIVRNAAPLFTLVFESLLNHSVPTVSDVFAVILVLVGGVLYEYSNAQASWIGIVLLLINLLCLSLDRVVEKSLLDVVDSSKSALVFLNNAIGGSALPFTLARFYYSNTKRAVRVANDLRTNAVHGGIVGSSCVMGLLLNYAGLRLQSQISAASMSIFNCMTKLIVVLWGVIQDGDGFDTIHIISITLSFTGCILYGLPVDSRKNRESFK